MRGHLLYAGSVFDLYAVVDHREACPAQQFIWDLLETDPREFTKLLALIELVRYHGLPRNPEKHKKLGQNLYELKSGHQRLLYFHDGTPRRLILTHGFFKRTRKTPRRQIARAEQLRDDYLGGER